ncbi:MAG: trypsin-like peptidase domain-containing protein [Clostridia bacterium]|nr:trypsin-like peptidase domain-containing protein [Clostridia bacterium]
MSFISDMERDRIYEEIEGKSFSKSRGGFFSKLLSIALLLSVGFASGSIYSTFTQVKVAEGSNSLEVNSSNVVDNTLSNSANDKNSLYSQTSLANVVDKTATSVVEITQYTTTQTYFNSSYTSEGNGSGVIISEDGYILTNNHVISGAEKISVRLRNGEEYEATLVGKDSKTDIAIIKIEATDLTPATMADSSNTLVGDFVLAIGNPLGRLGGTVTYGFVSALEREINLDSSTKNLMQFDAAVNPGNSGGGLFNVYGELIGVVSAKSTGYDVEGLGFAIPINDVKQVINDILERGYATNRPYLGVSLDNSSYSTGSPFGGGSIFDLFYSQVQYGARVSSVEKDSPADEAGIEVNDIIVSIGGAVVSSASDATSEIQNYNVGDEVEIGIIRNNRTYTKKAILAEYTGQ